MSTFSQYSYGSFGSGISVSADGSPVAKVAGVEVDWESVAAHTAAVTYDDSDSVEVDEKFIRYGTVLCRIATASVDSTKVGKFAPYGTTSSGADTITLSNAADGQGNWVVVNRSVHENDVNSSYPEVIEAGRVYIDRLNIEGTGGALSNEVQTVTVDATGGTFTLTFSGQTTSAIAENASAATVLAALEALSNIAPGDVTVTGSAGGPYTVTFKGVYANTNVPLMTANAGSLTGGASTVVVAVAATSGVPYADFKSVFPRISFVRD